MRVNLARGVQQGRDRKHESRSHKKSVILDFPLFRTASELLEVAVIVTDNKLNKTPSLNKRRRTTMVVDLYPLQIIIRIKNRGWPVHGNQR